MGERVHSRSVVRTVVALAVAVIAALGGSRPAAAADVPISTKVAKLSKHVSTTVLPPRARFFYASRDPIDLAGNDPSATGATLTIFDRSLDPPGPPSYASVLPASGWQVRGAGAVFRQRTDAYRPVARVVLSNHGLRIVAKSQRNLEPATLPEVKLGVQGPYDVVLSVGTTRVCATLPARDVFGGNHRFAYSAYAVAAPAACPVL